MYFFPFSLSLVAVPLYEVGSAILIGSQAPSTSSNRSAFN